MCLTSQQNRNELGNTIDTVCPPGPGLNTFHPVCFPCTWKMIRSLVLYPLRAERDRASPDLRVGVGPTEPGRQTLRESSPS